MQSDNIKAAEIFWYLYKNDFIHPDEFDNNRYMFISHYMIYDYTPRYCIRESNWFKHFTFDDIHSFEYQSQPILALIKHLLGDNDRYIEMVANQCHVRMSILETIPATNVFETLIQRLLPNAQIIFWEEFFVLNNFLLLKVSSCNIDLDISLQNCWSPDVIHIISFKREFGRRIAYKNDFDLNALMDQNIMLKIQGSTHREDLVNDGKNNDEINTSRSNVLMDSFISEIQTNEINVVDSKSVNTDVTDIDSVSVLIETAAITDNIGICSVDDKYYGFARDLDLITLVGNELSLELEIRDTVIEHIKSKLSQKKKPFFFPKYGKIYEIIQSKKYHQSSDDDITDDTVCEVVRVEHPLSSPDCFLFEVLQKLFTHQLVTIARSDKRSFQMLSNETLQKLISNAMIFVPHKYRFTLKSADTDLKFSNIDGYEYEDPKKMLPRLTFKYQLSDLCGCIFRCKDDCRNRKFQIFCDPSICSIQTLSGLEECGNHIIYCNHAIRSIDIDDPRMGTGLTNIEDFENERTVCGIYGGVVIDTLKESQLDDSRYENGEIDFYTLSLISDDPKKKKTGLSVNPSNRGSLLRLISHSCIPNCSFEDWYYKKVTVVVVVTKYRLCKYTLLSVNYFTTPEADEFNYVPPTLFRCICQEHCKNLVSYNTTLQYFYWNKYCPSTFQSYNNRSSVLMSVIQIFSIPMVSNIFLKNRKLNDELEEFQIGQNLFRLRRLQISTIKSGFPFKIEVQSIFLEAFIHILYVLRHSENGLVVTINTHPSLFQIFVVLLSYILDYFAVSGNFNPSPVDIIVFILEESMKCSLIDNHDEFINKSTKNDLCMMLSCFENCIDASCICSCYSHEVLFVIFYLKIYYT